MTATRTKRKLWWAGGIGLAALVLMIFAFGHASAANPVYRGKRLSTYLYDWRWFDVLGASGNQTPSPQMEKAIFERERKRTEAEVAIKELGPKAVPLLVSWMAGNTALRGRLRELAKSGNSRWRWLLRFRWVALDPRQTAEEALSFLIPAEAAPVLPILRQEILTGTPAQAEHAARLLAHLFNFIPAEERVRSARANHDLLARSMEEVESTLTPTGGYILGALLPCDPPNEVEPVVRKLWRYRNLGHIENAIQRLDLDGFVRNLIYLESGKPTEKPAAAMFFRDRVCAPERVVPLLIQNIDELNSPLVLEMACQALGAYGVDAAPALPALTRLQTHARPQVKAAARSAVEKIRAAGGGVVRKFGRGQPSLRDGGAISGRGPWSELHG